VDTSDNQSAISAATVAASVSVPSGLTSADVSGIIDATSFASGMTGVEVVASLPSTGNFDGRTAVLTTDGKLYRYASEACTASVPATDISGQLQAAQVAA
jgi:hypothetical protein